MPVLYSSGFLCVSSHYLILPMVSSLVVQGLGVSAPAPKAQGLTYVWSKVLEQLITMCSRHSRTWPLLKKYLFLFIYLAVPGLHCSMWDIFSCSLWTLSCSMWDQVPCIGVLVTGLPGKSHNIHLLSHSYCGLGIWEWLNFMIFGSESLLWLLSRCWPHLKV